MTSTLSIWFDGSDWVIAYSAEDAAKVWEEVTGDTWSSEDDGETWEPDNRLIHTIFFDEESDRNEYAPTGAELGKKENGPYYAKATQQQWIEKSGRGWFCSENF